MSEAAREVRVDIRQHTLAAAATLTETSEGDVFIALEHPPPVRSVLSVHDAGEARPLEVTRVVEVESDDGKPGIFGQFRDESALAVHDKVGTEHLESGEATAPPEEDADHAGYLAMPAPVVDPDPSDRIDVNEVRRLEDDEPDDGTSSEGDDGAGSKRRRGRKGR